MVTSVLLDNWCLLPYIKQNRPELNAGNFSRPCLSWLLLQGWPLPWRSVARVRGRRLKEHLSLQRGSDQTRPGRKEPSSTPSSRVFSNTNRAGLGAS